LPSCPIVLPPRARRLRRGPPPSRSEALHSASRSAPARACRGPGATARGSASPS
jgi:hypothetical protein